MKINASYRAGNITYRWLQGYTYELKFTTYTNNLSPDNYCEVSNICYGDNFSLTRVNGSCNGPCAPHCEGVVLSPDVKENEYIVQHTYPGPGSYKICFSQPNRNAGIDNIPNSVNQLFYMESYLVISTFSTPNNSPVFFFPPVASGCTNTGCFLYNPSATDSDGDSLSYEVMAISAPGSTLPGGGSPTFSINPLTGTVSWCNPTWTGDYNFTLRVKEWQLNPDGTYTLAGYTDRDTQLSIATCTGIDEVSENREVEVFPNPATDMLTIAVGSPKGLYTIELWDVAGRKLKTLLNRESMDHTQVVSLDGIDRGIYLLKITGDNRGTITKKLIKQ